MAVRLTLKLYLVKPIFTANSDRNTRGERLPKIKV